MSREIMQTLKAKKDEELRIEKVNLRVTQIYSQAVRYAETTTAKNFSLDIDPHQSLKRVHMMNDTSSSEYQFYKDNMDEILSGLQRLFPDCSVKLSNMCTGNDGKRYDISTMDEKMLPFINQKNAFECIVVDWS
jgi:hypothetical protein